MADEGTQRAAHRAWIAQARQQADAADRAALAAGTLLPGAQPGLVGADAVPGYTLEVEIHRGAQGAVYRAIQKSTGRCVALKLLHAPALGEPLERARFEREMRVLAALRHPNIVTVHDGGSHDGRHFLVMDYIAGQPLDLYMASRSRTIRETLELFAVICAAVNAAHVRGIIHRDLKPANVRVDDTDQPHVLDFGLAKLSAEAVTLDAADAAPAVTLTGHFLGSLPWAAPEQAEGSPARIDIRTDVYALGVILYQMLTGKFPYPVAQPIKEVLDHIVHAAPTPPRTLRHGIDDELETIVLKCLSKERERRYQTAGELGRDIRRYLAGEPIEAKRDSSWYVLRKTVRKHRLPLVVLLAFAALLLGSTVVAWTLSVQAREAARAAQQSEELARQRLADSLVAQAHAVRRTGRVGQRFAALDALARAAAIAPSLAARNEAIAAMALPDLRRIQVLREEGTGYFDATLERCAVAGRDGAIAVVRVADDAVLARIAAPADGLRELHAVALTGRYVVRLYDPPEGARRLEVFTLPELQLHFQLDDVPYQARFDISPDGRTLAVGRLDRAMHIYDLESGRVLQRLPLDRIPSYVSYDSSAGRLALYHGHFADAQILDLATGAAKPAFSTPSISWSVAWHPSGDIVAAAAGSRVEFWDVRSDRSCGYLDGHQAQVVSVRYSPDGRLLLTYSWDGATFLWDARTRLPLLQLSLAFAVFSTDGHRVAGTAIAGGRAAIAIYELAPALERRRLIGAGDTTAFAAASGGFDTRGELLVVGQAGVANDAQGIRVFDVRRDVETVCQLGENVWSLLVESTGRYAFACQDAGIVRWPIHSDGRGAILGSAEVVLPLPRPTTVSVSADGSRVVAGNYSEDEFAAVDLRTGASRRFAAPRRGNNLCSSPDGVWVVIDGANATDTYLWNLEQGREIHKWPGSYRGGHAFSPDGARLYCSTADGLQVRDTRDWRVQRRAAGQFGAIRLSPDGSMLACFGDAPIIRLIDTTTLEELAALEPPENFHTSDLAFNPEGSLLAQLTNHAGVVHLWDLGLIRDHLEPLGLDWKFTSTRAGDADR